MRRRQLSIQVAAILLLAACSTPAHPPSATADDGWGPSLDDDNAPRTKPVVPRALPIPVSQRKRWTRADEIAALTVLNRRTPSEHLDGILDRTVAINALARDYATLTRTTAMPEGALIVQRHHPRGSDQTSVYFVMERRAPGTDKTTRDWRFLVLDAELRVAAEKNLALCARCHVDAPNNGLFGYASEG